MNWPKKRILCGIVLVLLMLCLILILNHNLALPNTVKKYEKEYGNLILGKRLLSCGDVLFVRETPEGHWMEYSYELADIIEKKSFGTDVWNVYQWCNWDVYNPNSENMDYTLVPLFNNGETETIPDDCYLGNGAYFTWYGNDVPTLDYIIVVTPTILYSEKGNSVLPYHVPQKEWDIPFDTLSTVAIEVPGEDTTKGYPAWYFVIPRSEITSDYRLYYGDYVLTGDDLLHFRWGAQK